ncbi:hypothetical protein BCR44DRAFT_1524616 [Catenaria anguillulae PL171]|uniref:C2H2-type domain-containing protein n=1 Tax=Catenaria anguillulae PL171 TaxID=765915 RepID=A0A1Y2HR24_9FUNG|nr:hypothetical protein BCR44DRAFT_1524616 [Catenaria anguillulae PL171]
MSSFAASASSSRQAPPPSLLALRLEQLASSAESQHANANGNGVSSSGPMSIPAGVSRAYLDLPTTPTHLLDPTFQATTPGSPMPGTGIVPPYGTPHSLNGGSYMPTGPLTPNKMHFDPYPAPPAPTPASSYVSDAAPVHAMAAASLLGSSLGNTGSAIPTRGSGTPQLTPRPRRRSSLSIVMTPTMGSTAAASTENSQAPTPIDEDVAMSDLMPIDEHTTIDTPPRPQPSSSGHIGARPRTLTADASAAAAALLGTQGAALALGGKRDKVYVCDECGKMFRSSNSLAQHRTDHSQTWRAASQPQLPSHQQVQLLEAAKILATLNQAPTASNGAAVMGGGRKSNFGSGTTSSESTIPSSPSADDDLVFPMQDDGPSTMA